MLQKIDRERLQVINNLIEKNNVKFPVAAITKGTGFAKSQVSGILKGKLGVSDKFYKAVQEMFNNSSNIRLTKDEEIASLRAAVKILTLKIVEHESKITGVSFSKASLDLEKMMQSEGAKLSAGDE